MYACGQTLSSPPTGRRPFMVVCVHEPRSRPNASAVLKAVKGVLEEGRRDSLLSKVKQYLRDCTRWPQQIEEKLPVVVEVKGLGEVGEMRQRLLDGLRDALGVEKAKPKVVSGSDIMLGPSQGEL